MYESQIKALINLIKSEDGDNAEVLKRELAGIIGRSPATFKHVLRADFKDGTPDFVRGVLENMAFNRLKNSFKSFAGKINPDLQEALELCSKIVNPLSNPANIMAHIDDIVAKLRPFIINCADGYDAAEAMQILFFDTFKFKVATANLRPDYMSFEKFLNARVGSGLMMAALYSVIGQRFNIEVDIVDFAGRLLVQFKDPVSGAHFFIDTFDKGKLITLRECMEFISARNIEWNDNYLRPLSTHAITRRALANLIFVYRKIKDEKKLSYLRNYLNLIEI
ncbi:regulator of sirC expression with transglutaminase-like and TPR domain [Elusimicrobium simillimum]|uniref:transglutaminase family protein n=1 Tax=Elusimicrobium simillimum TaxID=3143438 RepID=UPI003C6EC453